MSHSASPHRYDGMHYRRTGKSGLKLPAISLGLWHTPPGSAEETCGRVLAQDLRAYRDELVISTKAGYSVWPGPYGDFGSRKYLVASLEQSLMRLGLEYVALANLSFSAEELRDIDDILAQRPQS